MEQTKNLGLNVITLDDESDIETTSENFIKLDGKIGEIMENTQEATEKRKGIISIEDIRTEESYLSGTKYSGIFSEELKEIKTGNSYLYIDDIGNGIIYEAINNKTNTTGFLVPDTTNFKNITNSDISKKFTRSNLQIENGGWVDLPAGQLWETFYGYSIPVSKVIAVRLEVDTWTNAYMDAHVAVLCFMNDKVGYKNYVKNYDTLNNAIHFSFEIECTNNSMHIVFRNLSTTITLRMRISSLKLFY